MFEREHDPVICYNCEEEFVVHSPYETDADVCFCPFCGSEVETDEFDDEEEEDDE